MAARKRREPVAIEEPMSEGVAALDRAIAILNAFTPADRALTLAELSARTGLYKSTILRLVTSLIRGELIEKQEDGRYRIGPATFRMGAVYQRSVAPSEILLPVMRALADASGESVAFYARSGEVRTCLYRVESRHAIRYHVHEGDVLPLDSGSGGRVLAAFSGADGEPYDTIRSTLHFISLGDRDPEIAGISAPVFGPGATLIGALTLAGPSNRFDAAVARRSLGSLLKAAAAATRAFGGDAMALEKAAMKSAAEHGRRPERPSVMPPRVRPRVLR